MVFEVATDSLPAVGSLDPWTRSGAAIAAAAFSDVHSGAGPLLWEAHCLLARAHAREYHDRHMHNGVPLGTS